MILEAFSMQHASEYAIEYKWGLLIFKFLLPKYRARILTYECLILMIGRTLKTNVGLYSCAHLFKEEMQARLTQETRGSLNSS